MTDSDNQVSDDLDEFLDRPAAGMWTRRRKIIAAIVAAPLVILLIIWATTSGGDQQRYAVAEVARGDMVAKVREILDLYK